MTEKMVQISSISLIFFLTLTVHVYASDINPVLEITDLDTTEVLAVAEVMPEIIGGIQEVYKNIEYPRLAIQNGVEGRVFIKFIVDANGNVKDPQLLKDIGAGCGDAAIEGIKKVKFKPGTNGGKPVSVFFTLPVTFEIRN